VRNASTLIVVEHNDAELTPATLHSVTAAKQLGGDVTCLVAGTNCGPVSLNFFRKMSLFLHLLITRLIFC